MSLLNYIFQCFQQKTFYKNIDSGQAIGGLSSFFYKCLRDEAFVCLVWLFSKHYWKGVGVKSLLTIFVGFCSNYERWEKRKKRSWMKQENERIKIAAIVRFIATRWKAWSRLLQLSTWTTAKKRGHFSNVQPLNERILRQTSVALG